MTPGAYPSFLDWYRGGPLSSYVREARSSCGLLTMVEAAQPAGDMSDPALPELVLYQDLRGGTRVNGDMGAGRFRSKSEQGGFYLSASNFANTIVVDDAHELRSVSFPTALWQETLEAAHNGAASFDFGTLHRGAFNSLAIRAGIQKLWRLCDEEGAPSRLLAQAAGCEILAELCRLRGAPLTPTRGGLAPWVERRSLELMRERLSEDLGLDELAAEARLSPYHFARMFKHSFGAPPRAYLVRLRMERACSLLEETDLPITAIAHEVGYASSQAFARSFIKHKRASPSAYRREVQR